MRKEKNSSNNDKNIEIVFGHQILDYPEAQNTFDSKTDLLWHQLFYTFL